MMEAKVKVAIFFFIVGHKTMMFMLVRLLLDMMECNLLIKDR
jgi:hypothetical protein